jgi:hypothetical protein
MLYELDISDRRLYDYLAEQNEQEADEEEYETFFDEAMDWQMERERDYDRD